ncbi:hypothetical protein PPERSA_12077 [Pseudocohnilembus persalinus]|uniref:TMS membrane protein/tumor differentially expressed protein n=1 Tax=Pseudocohnilembus persalinus TaxID=266149 RepID=A0A0V0R907_PSEPJ|nr:hypothetical protein PPERSA_12077 [Pseudocohnilembus persalinus]|eukprot:KRX10953.1 hypothetical protein PPERSA_12077 [Pseudocohnilembus persalinus]
MCIGLCIRGACCCCEACCNDCCKLLKFKLNISIRQQMRMAYISLSFCAIIFAVFLKYIAPSSLGFWTVFIHCPEQSGGGLLCLGVSAVYRMSAALALTYLVLLVACLMRDDCARFLNESFWCLKIFLVLGLFFGFMFVNNSIFQVYAEISQYASVAFLLFQIVMLIDIFYLIGEKMKYLYDEGYNIMGPVLIGTALILYSLTFLFVYYNFQWFPCNQTINIVNLFLIIVLTALIFTGYFPNGSLITGGFVSLYLTFQIWSSLNNNENQECNHFSQLGEGLPFKLQVGFGVFFMTVSLLYIALLKYEDLSQAQNQSQTINVHPNTNPGLFDQNKKDSDDDRDFLERFSDIDDEEDNNNKQQGVNSYSSLHKQNQKQIRRQKRLRDYQSNYYINFHLIMLFCSFYSAMLLTNWGAPNLNDMNWTQYKSSDTSRYINLFCSYVSWGIYIWTLIAPKIFPDRDFSR